MHMADGLISGTVGGVMAAASVAIIAYSIKRIKSDDKTIPMMGVMGAFVFAMQMINFTIPGTGSSGHIVGGTLLAATLGVYPAIIVTACVLIIQCLLFADGGLLALGCNIFNMSVPFVVMYTLIFKPILKNGVTSSKLTIASILSVVLGLQLSAFGVVLETTASGITALPFLPFVLAMQPIHFVIGIVEGVITAAVLIFVYKMRPEILEDKEVMSVKVLAVTIALLAVLIGGGLSMFASGYPDGLEWSMEKVAGTTELEGSSAIHETMAEAQKSTAFMPDYNSKIAGIVGGALTLLLAVAIGFAISFFSKKRTA
ncbi:MAG: energy-coupling factor ABC transporter permease [Deferribacteraceae bacterium]|jgi:cobalt/nickel transport system permease protein|nr:energy-coupling factor ABC transporter permease [Deferribacteraceae bacterium]